MSRSVNGVEPEISCGFSVMHGLEVVFLQFRCHVRGFQSQWKRRGSREYHSRALLWNTSPWEIYALQLGNTKLETGALVWKAAVAIFE